MESTQETADRLAIEGYSYLKEIEYWTNRYNEVVSALRDIGYYQAGEILTRLPFFDRDNQPEEFQHCVFTEDEEGGNTYRTASAILEEIAAGPEPRSSYFRGESKELKKDNAAITVKRISSRDKRQAALGAQCDWICIYCQSKGTDTIGPDGRPWHIDHLFPKARGGDSKSDNLVLACATCNCRKNSQLASEILAAIKSKLEAA